jgi:hypothetical protein
MICVLIVWLNRIRGDKTKDIIRRKENLERTAFKVDLQDDIKPPSAVTNLILPVRI